MINKITTFLRPALRCATAAALALGAACAAEGAQHPSAARIVVDSTTRFQVMTGWEATAQSGQDAADFLQFRDRLLTFAADTLGINRVRLEVRSGVENTRDYWTEMRQGRLAERWDCVRYATVNDNADPNVINWAGFQFADLDWRIERVILPLKQKLEARGERLFINLEYVAFVQKCPNVSYIHTDPEEYAEFILATSLHLRDKYHIVPDAWEVMLEPDNTPFWRGEQLGHAIVATARRLRAAGFDPHFIAPSTTSMAAAVAYFEDLARVPGAAPLVTELSYHRYRGVGQDALRAIAETAAKYHVGTAMLEHIGSDVEDLYHDLSVANVGAWQQYVLAYSANDRGAQYIQLQKAQDGTVTPVLASRSRMFRQYFLYVRRGARRIGASGDDPGLAPLAWINPGGRFAVVVKAGHRGEVSVAGLPPGRYAVSYATADELSPERFVTIKRGRPVTAAIPARGVLTIARK